MAGENILLAICALATLGICYSQVQTGGRVNVLSANESLELFCVAEGRVSPLFSATLDISLRPPCPSCHPSYNYIVHTDQLIVPSTALVSFFTFLPKEPFVYTQAVSIPNCEPLSIYESPLSPNLLYLDCKEIENNGNFFLAQLERFQLPGGSDNEDSVWVFSTLPGFLGLDEAGTYAGVMGFSSFMMLYVHESQDHIELNGFLSGYISILTKPEECSNVVRITATGTSGDNKLLLECSNTDTELVSTVHILDSVTSIHLLTTLFPYKICPMRFSPDGSVVAIFTEFNIIVIDLVCESYTNVVVNQSVYDGVVSQSSSSSNTLYLVYSTVDGLYRVTLSFTASSKTAKRRIEIGSVSIFPNTMTICAKEGCPLMYMVNEDLFLAAVDTVVSLFSISSLERAAEDITTQHPPSRFMFQSTINDSLCRVISPSVCSVTMSSLEVTIVPSPQAVILGLSARGQITTTAAAGATAAGAVVVLAALIVLLLIAARKKKLMYLGRTAITRYKRSSDRVELISCTLGPTSNETESVDSSLQQSVCSTDSGIIIDDCAPTTDSDNKCELLMTTRENADSAEMSQTVMENEETSIGQLYEDARSLCAPQEVGNGKHHQPQVSKPLKTKRKDRPDKNMHVQEEQRRETGGKWFVHGNVFVSTT